MAELSDLASYGYEPQGDSGFGSFGGLSPSGFSPVGYSPAGGLLGSVFKVGKSLLGKIGRRGGSAVARAARAAGRAAKSPAGAAALGAGVAELATGAIIGELPGRGLMLPATAGGVAMTDASGLFTMAGAGVQRWRPVSQVTIPGPDGRLYHFRYAGRPVLYSGDFACARRVQRVAARAARRTRRASGGFPRRRRTRKA